MFTFLDQTTVPSLALSRSPLSPLDYEVPASFSISTRLLPSLPLSSTSSSILLTGSTGFLGCFLLCSLLRHTNASIICLNRASSDCTRYFFFFSSHLFLLSGSKATSRVFSSSFPSIFNAARILARSMRGRRLVSSLFRLDTCRLERIGRHAWRCLAQRCSSQRTPSIRETKRRECRKYNVYYLFLVFSFS